MNKMRTEKEMFDLILNVAREDQNVRAVYMNGSRTNPNVPKDLFQDYDIVYVVNDINIYLEKERWVDLFGEILYMQMPDKMDLMRGQACNIKNRFAWLILFKDGNRIDLTVQTISNAREVILSDPLCKLLLDKDSILPKIPESNDEAYWVKSISKMDYYCDCNEFWWVINNAVKGLARDEMLYVFDTLNLYVRPVLIHFLSVKVGIQYNFKLSVGKSAKYLKQYLDTETYQRLLETFLYEGNSQGVWKALYTMCDLFSETAREIGNHYQYEYSDTDEKGAIYYLNLVREMTESKNPL